MNNDLKYVLLPTVDDQRRPPKFQPWYRERIRMKYPCHINTRNWTFVKDGLDDFRDGLPPSHDDLILASEKGPGPILKSENRRIKSSASNIQKRLNEHQIYLSREIPAAEKRRQTINNYISEMLQHPMAFFSHFSETLSPKIYEKVTQLLEAELLRASDEDKFPSMDEHKEVFSSTADEQILRPNVNLNEESFSEVIPQQTEKTTRTDSSNDLLIEENNENEKQSDDSDSKISSTRPGRSAMVYDESGTQWNVEEFEKKQKNPYRWFVEKQRQKEKAKGPSQEEQAATAMEARLRNVSEEFCTWLYDLVGKSDSDIDSTGVRNLFSTAYDTKPSLSVPIKIVEMARIPIELREGVEDKPIAKSTETSKILSEVRVRSISAKSRHVSSAQVNREKSAEKYRYGAWYLRKQLWQRSLTNEELRDPKIVQAEREDATRKRQEEINSRLAPLHGVNAFKEYLQEKNIRRLPKLIIDVEQYRREHPREVTNSALEFQRKRSALSTYSNT